MKKVLFIDYWPEVDMLDVSGAGIGSSLFKLAAFSDAFDLGFGVNLLTSPVKKELFTNSDIFNSIKIHPQEVLWDEIESIVCMGIKLPPTAKSYFSNLECFTYKEEDKEKYKSSHHITFWRHYVAKHLGFEKLKQPARFPLGAIEKKRESEQRIAISYQSISRLKEYDRWEEVIALLLKNLPKVKIILLGHQVESADYGPQVENYCGKTSVTELKNIVTHCDVVIGTDSFMTNLAMVLGKPSLVLFSIISPDWIVDPHQNLRSKVITLKVSNCPYQFCYGKINNYREGLCLNNEGKNAKAEIECLQFQPEEIVVNTLKLMTS